MALHNSYGVISATEAYSLDQLGAIFNQEAEWARDYFVRPIDRRTKKRKIDPRTGEPMRGVPHVRAGHKIIVAGAALLRWLEEHSECVEDGEA